MPKTEAEIALSFQVELDKTRTDLLNEQRASAKLAKTLEEKDMFYTMQIEEMREAIQELSPDKFAAMKKKLSETTTLHGNLLTDFEKEVADHQDVEEQLTAANATIATVQLSLGRAEAEVKRVQGQLDDLNGVGDSKRPRMRRSRRT